MGTGKRYNKAQRRKRFSNIWIRIERLSGGNYFNHMFAPLTEFYKTSKELKLFQWDTHARAMIAYRNNFRPCGFERVSNLGICRISVIDGWTVT